MSGKRAFQILLTIVFCAVGTAGGAPEGKPVTPDVTGGGLKGEYYITGPLGLNPAAPPKMTPMTTRVDPRIDFDWRGIAPALFIDANDFTVRWTGYLLIAVSGVYTFSNASGGFLLEIGGERVLSPAAPSAEVKGTIELSGGQMYPVLAQYYNVSGRDPNNESGGGAGNPVPVQLFWESPSIPRQVVPTEVLQPPVWAYDPTPADGAREVVQHPILKWFAGSQAYWHHVYLGTDPNLVLAATTTSRGIYRGRQSFATTFDPGLLSWGRTYYWRIDEAEYGGTPSFRKGPVWSFTTPADHIPVDDFEGYSWRDGCHVKDTWRGEPVSGGYSSVVHDEVPISRSGVQSLCLQYSTGYDLSHSETYRTWPTPVDWTGNGVHDLSLWLKGTPVPAFLRSNGNIVINAKSCPGWADVQPVSPSGWGGAHYWVYKRGAGDGRIVVRIDSLGTDVRNNGKGGIVIQGSTGPTCWCAKMSLTPEGDLTFEHGLVVPGDYQWSFVRDGWATDVRTPCWLRLACIKGTVTPEYSADGESWRRLSDANGVPVERTFSTARDIYLGLDAQSRDLSTATVAEFSHIDLAGAWSDWIVTPGADYYGYFSGTPLSDMERIYGRPLDPIYVALKDNAGHFGLVVHPDPNVARTALWTEWRIPLSRFTDVRVDTASIKTMYIGAGDRARPIPPPSDSGYSRGNMLFIDDIQVVR